MLFIISCFSDYPYFLLPIPYLGFICPTHVFLGGFLELRRRFYMFSAKVWLLGFLVTECNQWFAPCCKLSAFPLKKKSVFLTWLDKLFFLTMKKVPSSSALVPICCLSGLLVLDSVFHLFKNEPDCRFGRS